MFQQQRHKKYCGHDTSNYATRDGCKGSEDSGDGGLLHHLQK